MRLDPAWLLHAALGLLPVLCFLGALLVLDSYKLVRLRLVLAIIAGGGVVAILCYLVNVAIIDATGAGLYRYTRYGSPLVEESLKSAVILLLIRTRRIGFLVDAAVLGFAVGAGFAVIENLYYLDHVTDPHVSIWIVRGFGTAIMHGGMQAIFAALVLANADRRGNLGAATILPPLAVAVIMHMAFNQFVLPPIPQTLLVLLCIPPLLLWVFVRSEKSVQDWIGTGFDADTQLLALLESGAFRQSRAGQYLYALRAHFPGEVVADLLCYLHLYVELALRAKGLLMLRENGMVAPTNEETSEKLEEMRYLERSVGPTALRTLHPLMQTSRRDLWQLYLLGK